MKRGRTLLAFLSAAVLAVVILASVPVEAVSVKAKSAAPSLAAAISCSELVGTPCDPPGARIRCYHIYPTEPGVCRCSVTGFWACG